MKKTILWFLHFTLLLLIGCNSGGDKGLQESLGLGSGSLEASNNSKLYIYSGNGQSLSPSQVSAPLKVVALDKDLVPLAGVVVSYSLTQGNGTLSSASATTDASGIASVTYTGHTSSESVSIYVSSSVGIINFDLNVTAPTEVNTSTFSIYGGNNQTVAPSGTSQPLQIIAMDSSNAPIVGLTVNYAITQGAGTLSAASAVTDSSGIASITYTASATKEDISVYASSTEGVANFSLTVNSQGSNQTLSVYSGNNQSISLSAVSAALKVRAIDENLDPINNLTITYTITQGDGTLSAASATTNAQGIASVTYTGDSASENVSIYATSTIGVATFNLTVGSPGGGGITYPTLTFAGLTSATVLDANSAKINFGYPTGGSGLYSYRLYAAGSYTTPITTISVSQLSSEMGANAYTVTGLTPSTTYNFVLRVYDALTATEDTNVVTETFTTPASVAGFAGIDSIDDVTTTSMNLNWTTKAGAVAYRIFNMTSGTPVLITTVASTATNYTVTGLNPSTTYAFRVRYEDSNGLTDSNTNDVTQATAATVVFAGATSTSNPSATTLRLNWTHVAGLSTYQVYNSTSGTNVLVANVTAPTNVYVITGLTPSSTYKFKVFATDTNGATVTNSAEVNGTTLSVTLTHQGWTDAYSTGRKVSYNGTVLAAKVKRLAWNEMTVNSGTITGYNLYRATSPAGPFTIVNGSTIPTNSGLPVTYNIADASTLTTSQAYYYQVKAIVGGSEITPASTAPIDHTIIRVITPPDNMALVHRWIANEEVCSLIGRGLGSAYGSETGNHYRCEYDGIGSTDAGTGTYYYDIGYDMLFDMFETGCNFSQSACSSHTDGTTTTTDCIGSATVSVPPYTGANGLVAYNRQHDTAKYNNCYYRNVGSWVNVTTFSSIELSSVASGGSGIGAAIASNAAHLPVLSNVNQIQMQNICQNFSVSISDQGSTLAATKRLPRRKEVIPAKAYPKSYSINDMNAISDSTHATGCGKTIATSANLDLSSDSYPNGPLNGGYGMVRTGSSTTASCVTRYGMQDMIANGLEWLSDQVSCDGSTNCTYNAANTIDPNSKLDWKGQDGVYFLWTSAANKFGDYQASAWWSTDGSTYFNPVMGVPMKCTGTYCTSGTDDNILVTAKTSGASVLNFFNNHERYVVSQNSGLLTSVAGLKSTYHDPGGAGDAGAAWDSSRFAHRTLTTAPNTVPVNNGGGRCMAPVVYQ